MNDDRSGLLNLLLSLGTGPPQHSENMSPLDVFNLATGLTPPPSSSHKKEAASSPAHDQTKTETEGEDLAPLFYQVI